MTIAYVVFKLNGVEIGQKEINIDTAISLMKGKEEKKRGRKKGWKSMAQLTGEPSGTTIPVQEEPKKKGKKKKK